MTRWWPLLPLLLAVLLTAAVDADARGRCDRHLRGAHVRTPEVVVFTRGEAEEGRRFYACRRGGGKPIFLGTDLPDDDFYGSDSTVRRVRAAGTYVSVLLTEGAASATGCAKYAGDPCPPIRRTLRVVDTRTRARTDVPVEGLVDRVALSDAGAIAWLAPGVLHASDLKAPPREIDRGAIAALRFTGRTLHWTRDGAPQSAELSG
jgi:hypothetical protein